MQNEFPCGKLCEYPEQHQTFECVMCGNSCCWCNGSSDPADVCNDCWYALEYGATRADIEHKREHGKFHVASMRRFKQNRENQRCVEQSAAISSA